jgi:hypothetical protein
VTASPAFEREIMRRLVSTLGHLDVVPALNEAEFQYLTGFAETRRCARPEGPLWVPLDPFGRCSDRALTCSQQDTRAADQPGLWCSWVPSCRGSCLTLLEGDEERGWVNHLAWLQYLLDTFLTPGAGATQQEGFEEFSFDHVVSGAVATYTGDGRLALLKSDGRKVWEEVLRPPDVPEWLE